MRKASSMVCAALVGVLGFGTLAMADPYEGVVTPPGTWRDGRLFDENGRAVDTRPGSGELQRLQERQQQQGWQGDVNRQYDNRRRADNGWRGERFQRGSYLPHEYRQRNYYVNNWRDRGLYQPPRGYQWMQVGNDYLLVALASGLIANLLSQ